jgi:predicted HD phosphohydrolase
MKVDEFSPEGFLRESREVYSSQAVTQKKTQRYHYRQLASAGWPVGWETNHPSGAVYLQHFHGAVYNQLWHQGVSNAILSKYRADHPAIVLEGEKPPVTRGKLPEAKKGQVLPGFVRASGSL